MDRRDTRQLFDRYPDEDSEEKCDILVVGDSLYLAGNEQRFDAHADMISFERWGSGYRARLEGRINCIQCGEILDFMTEFNASSAEIKNEIR